MIIKNKAMVLAFGIGFLSFSMSGCALLPFVNDHPFSQEKDEEASVPETVTAEPTETPTPTPEPTPTPRPEEKKLKKAKKLARQYNYNKAISVLKEVEGYEQITEVTEAIAAYEAEREACIEYQPEDVTHVFFHTLVKDNRLAFDGDSDEGGYNQYMTTIPEFNRMMDIFYEKGYVLVSVHDLASVDENGNVTRKTIRLPEGKIPFVISQDDVSYYHYMDDDGFASRLVVDENGDVKCEYIEQDGSVSVGDYDMVPLIDAFVEEHPDFSYHGRKGILAMTGYNGVLGYRTDIAYKTRENLTDDQEKFLAEHPDFDYEKECADAKAVAEAMKENGWEFASHTWGHKNVSESSLETLQADDYKWKSYVAPILGETDVIIFAFGADIGGWEGYSYDNEKFSFYKNAGYNYFCNVDSSPLWVQIGDSYFRQGRRNLDGYRMYYNPEMLEDLFDVSAVWDSDRPTPVPPM